MKIIYMLFWLIVIILAVTFTVLNAHVVPVDIYFHQAKLFLPLLLLIVLVLGIILGALAMLPVYFRHKSQARKLKGELKDQKKEVENLRAIPINDNH